MADLKTSEINSNNPYCSQTGCNRLREPGYNRCKGHNSKRSLKEATKRYALRFHQEKLDQMLSDGNFKDMQEEIALQRFLLQEILGLCEGPADFVVYHDKITKLTESISNLIVKTHKIEHQMGQLMNKQALLQVADAMLNSITKNITDPNIIDIIAKDVTDAIEYQTELTLSGEDS